MPSTQTVGPSNRPVAIVSFLLQAEGTALKKLLLAAILMLSAAALSQPKPIMAEVSETGYSAHRLEWITEKWMGDEEP